MDKDKEEQWDSPNDWRSDGWFGEMSWEELPLCALLSQRL
jgi:hypothetical protein